MAEDAEDDGLDELDSSLFTLKLEQMVRSTEDDADLKELGIDGLDALGELDMTLPDLDGLEGALNDGLHELTAIEGLPRLGDSVTRMLTNLNGQESGMELMIGSDLPEMLLKQVSVVTSYSAVIVHLCVEFECSVHWVHSGHTKWT